MTAKIVQPGMTAQQGQPGMTAQQGQPGMMSQHSQPAMTAGQAAQPGMMGGNRAAFTQKIPNYLVPAILSTCCCCVPFGIVAIVYATQVDGKIASGDIAGAIESSKNAKMWCWISLGSGLVGGVIFAILGAIGQLAGIQ
ncbi:MAG: CD225/dispanin family protein [Candidatus Sumerlaeota bacterium]|nr:CD225/dispanin family protein [Candidatus Sumerlaeota bacterium]